MKKLSVVLLALTLLVTPYAQAKTCFGISCNYIDAASNSGFQATPWDLYWTAGGASPVTETCYSTTAAEIGAGDVLTRDQFYVDNNYTNGFSLQFRLQLPGDTNSAYDQLVVRVKNDDTNVSEVFYFNGNSFTSACGKQIITLSNNYSYHNVTVSFQGSGLTAHPWHVDDVAFFAYY
jgi:hypothetical protein